MEVRLTRGLTNSVTIDITRKNLLGGYAPGRIGVSRPLTAQLQGALLKPIGRQAIKQYATHKSNCLIIIDDLTRTTAVRHVLPVVMQPLEEAGLDWHGICILVALGTHRPLPGRKKDR